jgi:hypothetical protein
LVHSENFKSAKNYSLPFFCHCGPIKCVFLYFFYKKPSSVISSKHSHFKIHSADYFKNSRPKIASLRVQWPILQLRKKNKKPIVGPHSSATDLKSKNFGENIAFFLQQMSQLWKLISRVLVEFCSACNVLI